MSEPFDVFVSYKREDQPFAETLRERLADWGLRVWMDVHNIPAGADWPVEIEKGLRASHTVIAVMTPQAVVSPNVQNEWEWSIVHEKRLIPLMFQKCDVPLNLIRKNYIDFVPDHEAGFSRLKTALESKSVPTPPDPYREYLQKLYDRINKVLAQAIIKINPDKPGEREPIPLISERTRAAVDGLFEQQDRIDPMLAAFGISSQNWESGDFRSAFEHFGGRVLLLGEPGTGKSITLLHFGRDAVVRRMQDPGLPLPIWALIPTWDAEEQTPLAEWLANTYEAPPNAAQIVAEGRALLLLDGLDELSGAREAPETNERYDPRQRFMEIIPTNNQVIVTCRVKDYEEIGQKIALKGAMTLQPLTDAQIRDYLSVAVPDLWIALEADEELRDVTRTPLLLSLFAFAYRDASAGDRAKLRDLQRSPGELRNAIFEQYVRKRYEREERRVKVRNPNLEMPFTLENIYRVLGEIGIFNIINAAILSRTDQIPVPVVETIVKRIGIDVEVFLNTLLLMHFVVEGKDKRLSFIHLYLRDHFAYRYALKLLGVGNWKQKEEASFALNRIGNPAASKALIEVLEYQDPVFEQTAAQIPVGLLDQRVRELAVHDLNLNRVKTWVNTARALGQFKSAEAVVPLIVRIQDVIRFFSSDSSDIWSQFAKAWSEEASERLKPWFGYFLQYATEALGKIGDSRAIPIVRNLLSGTVDTRIRIAAIEALNCIGTAEALATVEAWQKNEKNE